MAQRKCPLCKRGVKEIDFRNTAQMTHFDSVRRSNVRTIRCMFKHQRRLTHAIKQARFMALLYTHLDKISNCTNYLIILIK